LNEKKARRSLKSHRIIRISSKRYLNFLNEATSETVIEIFKQSVFLNTAARRPGDFNGNN
jgi:hypothetical protein